MELHMSDIAPVEQSHVGGVGDRYVVGSEAIGKFVGLSARQVSYFFRQGLFGNAVVKFGHRTLVGDTRQLQNLAFIKQRK
jgi:hypothetical protein